MKKKQDEEVNNNEDKKQRPRLQYPDSHCPLICPKLEEYYKEKNENGSHVIKYSELVKGNHEIR